MNSLEPDFSFMNLKMMSESLKRHSKLLSLIFILNCLTKTFVIRNILETDKFYIAWMTSYLEKSRKHFPGAVLPALPVL